MTIKKGKLTEIERFYIKHHLNVDTKRLSRMLRRSVRQVNQEKNRYKQDKLEDKEEIKEEEEEEVNIATEENKVDNLMGKHFRKGEIVATVMTPAASEMSDATRDSRVKLSKDTNKSIHRPRG